MFFDEKGAYNVESWMGEFTKHIKSKDQEFVLVCRSGNRTTMVGKFLSNQVGLKNVYHLQNGIKSWIAQGRQTVK
jgi:rhodanese-related sulfurtransferase